MNIEEMTIGDAKQIAAMFQTQAAGNKPVPFKIGEAYLIRTVTMAWHGVIKEIVGDFLVLEKGAAWIADTGRYADALKDANKFDEVEPCEENAIIGLGGVIDSVPVKIIKHSQK